MGQDTGATAAAATTASTAVVRFFARVRNLGIVRPAGSTGAGVCAGLAARSGWRVATVRAIFLVAALFMGAGPIVYGIAWVLLPGENDRIALEDALRGEFRAAFFGGIALVLLGLPGSSHQIRVGGRHVEAGIPWWLILGTVSLVWVGLDRRRRSPSVPGSRAAPPPGAVVGAGPVPAAATAPSARVPLSDEPTRRSGPGWRLVTGTLGLVVLAGLAGHLMGASLHRGEVVAAQLAVAAAVIVVGLGIVVAGVRGRRVGAGWLVPVLLVLSAPVGVHVDHVGDRVIPVTRLTSQRVDSAVGDTTIDLRRAVRDPGRAPAPVMRLVAGIGDVTVEYPPDLAVDTAVGRRLGEVEGAARHGRVGRSDGPADLRIVLDGGIGDVTFRQVDR